MQRLILEFAVRAALIALGTAGVLRLLQVKSAGARHAAWAGVLGLMMLLPGWTAWGPKASVRVLPALTTLGAVQPLVLSAVEFPATSFSNVQAVVAPRPQWNWWQVGAAIYLTGLLTLLARLAVGTLRARALVRTAVIEKGRLTSASCLAPVTVGWLTPAVILPASWRDWPAAQLDAVLTHEGEHARRRDPLVQWLALFNRAIFWFHPLAWWLERHLSALAEEACDAAVLSRGHDPYDYSEYLLQIARAIGNGGIRIRAVGMAMPGSSLPQRIRQILGRGPAPRMTRARAVGLATACITVSAVFAAATVERQQAPPPPPPPPPPVASMSEPPAPPAPPAVFTQTELPPPPTPKQRGMNAPPAPPAIPMQAGLPAPPPPPTPKLRAMSAPPPPPAMPVQMELSAPPPPAAPLTPKPQKAVIAPPAPPAAPAERRYSEARMVALYFDMTGMSADAQARAIAAGSNFVRNQRQPSDLVSILVWDGKKVVVKEDFTWEAEKLAATMRGISGDSNISTDTEKQLEGLRQATERLGVLSGKKLLIYFSNGMGTAGHSQQVQAVLDAAVRGNVAFYPVDARGLVDVNPHAYRLGAQDNISVSVPGNPQFDCQQEIRPDGMITIKLLGDIQAAGLTAQELTKAINDRFVSKAILVNPNSNVSILAIHKK